LLTKATSFRSTSGTARMSTRQRETMEFTGRLAVLADVPELTVLMDEAIAQLQRPFLNEELPKENRLAQLSRPYAGQPASLNPHRPRRQVDDEHKMRPETVAGGVAHDVAQSGHEHSAVIDEIVCPMASKPIAGRNCPVRVSDDAGPVFVEEQCSDERDRHRCAGTWIHVREDVEDRLFRRPIRGCWSRERKSKDAQQC
jgi:hypothetical protein